MLVRDPPQPGGADRDGPEGPRAHTRARNSRAAQPSAETAAPASIRLRRIALVNTAWTTGCFATRTRSPRIWCPQAEPSASLVQHAHDSALRRRLRRARWLLRGVRSRGWLRLSRVAGEQPDQLSEEARGGQPDHHVAAGADVPLRQEHEREPGEEEQYAEVVCPACDLQPEGVVRQTLDVGPGDDIPLGGGRRLEPGQEIARRDVPAARVEGRRRIALQPRSRCSICAQNAFKCERAFPLRSHGRSGPQPGRIRARRPTRRAPPWRDQCPRGKSFQ